MCGPPSLIAATRAIWERAGVGERVHSESFLPATVAAGTQGGRIRFARSDVEVSSDGRSLLEQAELAGLTPAYGCRMGICRTCTTRKLSGRVRDVRRGRTVERGGAGRPALRVCAGGRRELEL